MIASKLLGSPDPPYRVSVPPRAAGARPRLAATRRTHPAAPPRPPGASTGQRDEGQPRGGRNQTAP